MYAKKSDSGKEEKGDKQKDKDNKENKDEKEEDDSFEAYLERMLKPDPEGAEKTEDDNNKKWIAGILLLVVVIGGAVYMESESGQEISFLQFQNELLPFGYVDHVEVVNSKKVRVFMKSHFGSTSTTSTHYFYIESVKDFEDRLAQALMRCGMYEESAPIYYKTEVEIGKALLHSLPLIGSLLLLGYFISNMVSRTRKAGAGGIFSVGKSKAQLYNSKKSLRVRFADVAGCEEAKQEVSEFVSFLKSPARYQALGAKIPKGALLVGPPGTGKTMLAKATAGEAQVPFYSVSGADFIEVFGGVGPARVRDLFAQARKNAPCIIFLDEIDAIGRKRGGPSRNDERDNTINQLLVEMDGFASNKGIVVLAATNRDDILDPALLRPGRFDRQIALELPDIKSRVAVFMVHLRDIVFTGNTIEEYAKRLAARTPGFSGADIANVCNEAALIAARYDKSAVTSDDFEAAIDRVLAGLEKKTKLMSPAEREVVAYHEAGHALVGWLLPFADPVLKVSIIPRGRAALGFAQILPEESYLHSQEYLHNKICVLLAGRAAEEVKFNQITSGAQDDLEKVTGITYAEILKYGMSDRFGSLSYTDNNFLGYMGTTYSDTTLEEVDKEVYAKVEKFYKETVELIRANIDSLEKIAKLLLEKEVIHHEDIKTMLGEPGAHRSGHYSQEHAAYLGRNEISQ